jgi:hypothetical protein
MLRRTLVTALLMSSANASADPPPDDDHRVASLAIIGGTYVGVGAWMYFAWYHDRPTLPSWKFGGDGWLGDTTYAGGEDKFGHFWGDYTFARLGTKFLRRSGWAPLPASLISSATSLAAFTLVEVKDGFYYEFSPSDLSGDIAGSVLAVLVDNWPALDDAFDFRVQWYPSPRYRAACNAKPTGGECLDFVEDYSGQRYVFAYKPRSIDAIRTSATWTRYLQFVDPVIGFDSRNYKPAPAVGDDAPRRQEIFIGLSLDMQAVIDDWLDGRRGAAASARGVAHTVFEFANVPFTTLPVSSYTHSPDEPDHFGWFE